MSLTTLYIQKLSSERTTVSDEAVKNVIEAAIQGSQSAYDAILEYELNYRSYVNLELGHFLNPFLPKLIVTENGSAFANESQFYFALRNTIRWNWSSNFRRFTLLEADYSYLYTRRSASFKKKIWEDNSSFFGLFGLELTELLPALLLEDLRIPEDFKNELIGYSLRFLTTLGYKNLPIHFDADTIPIGLLSPFYGFEIPEKSIEETQELCSSEEMLIVGDLLRFKRHYFVDPPSWSKKFDELNNPRLFIHYQIQTLKSISALFKISLDILNNRESKLSCPMLYCYLNEDRQNSISKTGAQILHSIILNVETLHSLILKLETKIKFEEKICNPEIIRSWCANRYFEAEWAEPHYSIEYYLLGYRDDIKDAHQLGQKLKSNLPSEILKTENTNNESLFPDGKFRWDRIPEPARSNMRKAVGLKPSKHE